MRLPNTLRDTMKIHAHAFVAASLLLLPLAARAQQLAIEPEKSSPIYKAGEPVVWKLRLSGEGAEGVKELRYIVKRDSSTVIAQGVLPLQDGAARLQSKLDAPGTLLAEFAFSKANGEAVKGAAGATIEPFQIEPSAPEPEDFLGFWHSKIQELDAVPQNPVLASEPSGDERVSYWKITLDNIAGGHVRGQIARPVAGDKLPALLRLQYAGVYGLPKGNVLDYARRGWLTLNVSAHDLPLDEPAEFYKAQAEGALKNYTAIGAGSRDTSYFGRMILGCYRAIEYLKTRPDWDGKTLVVEGTSQGGLQSLAMGGLSPDVSAVIVNVPAGCDNAGPLVGRATPWPYWAPLAKQKPEVMETSRYFDGLNFARHIKAPSLVAVGLLDMTATTAGVIAAFNQIQAPVKQLVLMERSDHHGNGGAQAGFHQNARLWLDALRKGNAVPGAP